MVDNSNSPHQPNLHALLAAGIPHRTGPPLAPTTTANATTAAPRVRWKPPDATYVHPLHDQLQELEYPASMWTAPQPQPPKVRDSLDAIPVKF